MYKGQFSKPITYTTWKLQGSDDSNSKNECTQFEEGNAQWTSDVVYERLWMMHCFLGSILAAGHTTLYKNSNRI